MQRDIADLVGHSQLHWRCRVQQGLLHTSQWHGQATLGTMYVTLPMQLRMSYVSLASKPLRNKVQDLWYSAYEETLS